MRKEWGTRLLHSRRAWLSLAIAAVLATGAIDTALAQQSDFQDIRVSLVADRAELTVGDPISLTLEVVHPEDYIVLVPRLDTEWGAFEVRRQKATSIVQNGDGTRTTSQELEVTLFAPGGFDTPGFPLSVRLPDGSVEQLLPEPVTLTVVSVLTSEGATLKDIRAPADFSTPLWEQVFFRVLLANVAAAGVLAVLGLMFYRRSRGRREGAATAVVHRTPSQIALEEFGRIESLGLAEGGRVKEHYALVSRALRVYLQSEQFGDSVTFDAVDMTTDEIGDALRDSSVGYEMAAEFVALLTEADLVKFANDERSPEQAREVIARARRIVEAMSADSGASSGLSAVVGAPR